MLSCILYTEKKCWVTVLVSMGFLSHYSTDTFFVYTVLDCIHVHVLTLVEVVSFIASDEVVAMEAHADI